MEERHKPKLPAGPDTTRSEPVSAAS